jgi:ankyrin repeat protein
VQSGWSALFIAAGSGHLDCLKELLDRGADVNALHEVRYLRRPTLLLVHKTILRVQSGRTALFVAAGSGHLDCLKELLDRGAAVNHKAKVRDLG